MYIISLLPRSLEGNGDFNSQNIDANRYLMKKHSQGYSLIRGTTGAYTHNSIVQLFEYELIELNVKEVLQ